MTLTLNNIDIIQNKGYYIPKGTDEKWLNDFIADKPYYTYLAYHLRAQNDMHEPERWSKTCYILAKHHISHIVEYDVDDEDEYVNYEDYKKTVFIYKPKQDKNGNVVKYSNITGFWRGINTHYYFYRHGWVGSSVIFSYIDKDDDDKTKYVEVTNGSIYVYVLNHAETIQVYYSIISSPYVISNDDYDGYLNNFSTQSYAITTHGRMLRYGKILEDPFPKLPKTPFFSLIYHKYFKDDDKDHDSEYDDYMCKYMVVHDSNAYSNESPKLFDYYTKFICGKLTKEELREAVDEETFEEIIRSTQFYHDHKIDSTELVDDDNEENIELIKHIDGENPTDHLLEIALTESFYKKKKEDLKKKRMKSPSHLGAPHAIPRNLVDITLSFWNIDKINGLDFYIPNNTNKERLSELFKIIYLGDYFSRINWSYQYVTPEEIGKKQWRAKDINRNVAYPIMVNGYCDFEFREENGAINVYNKHKWVGKEQIFHGDPIATFTDYIGYWLGENTSNSYYVGEQHGNTIIVKLNDTEYLDSNLNKFTIPNNDEIVAYYSPIGNNGVPYPSILCKNGVIIEYKYIVNGLGLPATPLFSDILICQWYEHIPDIVDIKLIDMNVFCDLDYDSDDDSDDDTNDNIRSCIN